MKFLCLVVVIACLATVVQAIDNWACNVCVISLGLLEEATLQIRLEEALKKKCDRSGKCDVDMEVKCGNEKHALGKKACEEKAKLEKSVCEEKQNLEGKVCVAAVDEIMHVLLKKIQPDALCGHMNMCKDQFALCELYPAWPLKHLPDSPSKVNPWPVERRLTQSQRNLYDFSGIKTAALEKFLQGIMERYVLPEEPRADKFYTFANVILHVLKELLHEDPSQDPSGVPEYDKCGLDLQCKLAALQAHEPLQDVDGDRFSTIKTLRGTDWRGEDCDDINKDVYPGRALENTGPLGRDIDHNCNKIVGGNSTGSYEDMFCAGSGQRGLIMLGDSATAHFHVPPQWVTADGWNLHGALKIAEDEIDFPHCSWGTGHADLTRCPFQDEVPGVSGPSATSLYSQLRDRNRCNHNDYQNIGVNGARMTSSLPLVNSMARRAQVDQPALVWLSLIGNDVCNGHPGTDHMTTPEQFRESAMDSLNALDATLPPGSYVVSLALVQGELLYDTMHNHQHPLGPSYKDVYDWLICMEESPCMGWLNSNQTARQETTRRADQLNQVYVDIAATETFTNFKYIYYTGGWLKMFGDYIKQMGVRDAVNLIEKTDGFHPSQAGNALFAKSFFQFLEAEHPDAIGPINPRNAEIDAMFFSQAPAVENAHTLWIKEHGSLEGCCGCDCHCSNCGGACSNPC